MNISIGDSKTIPCPICNSTDFSLVSDLDRYGIPIKTVCCSSCGLVFVNPQPSKEWTEMFYKNHYRNLYEEVDIPSREYCERKDMAWKHRQSIAFFSEYLDPTGNILDIGAADGAFLRLFREKFPTWELSGIEPNAKFVNFVSKEYDLPSLKAGLFPQDLEGSTRYDFLHVSHVFEHILEPLNFLKACWERLAEDGMLYLEVPNALNFRKSYRSVHIAHVFHYCPKTLEAILNKAGFKVLKMCDSLVVPSRKKKRQMPLNVMVLAKKTADPLPVSTGYSTAEIQANIDRLKKQWHIPFFKKIRLKRRAENYFSDITC